MTERLELQPHPSSPPDAIACVSVDIHRTGARLDLVYRIGGDIARLYVPGLEAGERTDNLWQTTCAEAFIQPEGGEGYYEFNLSPSTRWAAYSFTGYRQDMANLTVPVPNISAPAKAGAQLSPSEPLGSCVRRNTHILDLTATVWLPDHIAALPWRVGLTTVIEETSGRKSFWALAHPSPEPDFHNQASFLHRLPA